MTYLRTILLVAALGVAGVAAAQQAPTAPRPNAALNVSSAPITVRFEVTYVYQWNRKVDLVLDPAIPFTCAANPQQGQRQSCSAAVPIGATVMLTTNVSTAGGAAGWSYTPPSVLGQGWYPKQCKMVNNGIGCQLKVTGPMTVTIGA